MEKRQIKIKTEYIKLDQLLKFAYISYSGGQAKNLIKMGSIKVNGQVTTQRGKKIFSGDKINILDEILIEVE